MSVEFVIHGSIEEVLAAKPGGAVLVRGRLCDVMGLACAETVDGAGHQAWYCGPVPAESGQSENDPSAVWEIDVSRDEDANAQNWRIFAAAHIEQLVFVSDDLRIRLPRRLGLSAWLRRQDGYMWVELWDMRYADYDDERLIDCTGVFGDYYAGTGYSPEIVREKTTGLIKRFLASDEGAKFLASFEYVP